MARREQERERRGARGCPVRLRLRGSPPQAARGDASAPAADPIPTRTQRPLRRPGTRRRGPSAGRCFPARPVPGSAGGWPVFRLERAPLADAAPSPPRSARRWLPPRWPRRAGQLAQDLTDLDRSMRPFGSRRRGPPAGRLFRAPRHRVRGGVRCSGRGVSSPARAPWCARCCPLERRGAAFLGLLSPNPALRGRVAL